MSNHVIYDRIWVSQKLAKCSLKAALAYPWIYLVADDWGRFEFLHRVIWGKVFGGRTDVKAAHVAAWLAEYRRVGLLDIYEADGRFVAEWCGFVGPPPSKRSVSLLPDRNGVYDTEGFRGQTRFHLAARRLPKVSPETGNGKRETGNEKREREPRVADAQETRPSRSPDQTADDPDRETAAREVEDLAATLAERTQTDPKTWVSRASAIPAQDGRPAKSFEDPRRRGLSVPWLRTTARKLREIRDEAVRPVPL
jgi:hypothetical protein